MKNENLVIGIDPGPMESAMVVLSSSLVVIDHCIENNESVSRRLHALSTPPGYDLVIEMPKSYGNAVGDSIFETCVWVGRFIQVWGAQGGVAHRLHRKTVVTHLCHNSRAGDSNTRRALMDLFPQTGGGREPSVGSKKEPGPLYGIRLDEWQALALALVWLQTVEAEELLLT